MDTHGNQRWKRLSWDFFFIIYSFHECLHILVAEIPFLVFWKRKTFVPHHDKEISRAWSDTYGVKFEQNRQKFIPKRCLFSLYKTYTTTGRTKSHKKVSRWIMEKVSDEFYDRGSGLKPFLKTSVGSHVQKHSFLSTPTISRPETPFCKCHQHLSKQFEWLLIFYFKHIKLRHHQHFVFSLVFCSCHIGFLHVFSLCTGLKY